MRRKAVILGVNHEGLLSAEDDADRLAVLLAKHYEFPQQDLHNLSASQMIEFIEEFVEDLDAKDQFLFYFAGHSDRDNKSSMLRLAIKTSIIDNYRTWLRASTLLEVLQECEAKTFAIFDSCKASAILKTAETLNCFNFSVLTAASPYDDVHEINQHGVNGGVLSHFLCKCLTEKPAEIFKSHPYLKPSSLKDWINDQIANYDWSKEIHKAELSLVRDVDVFKIISLEEKMGKQAKDVLQISDSLEHILCGRKFPNAKLLKIHTSLTKSRDKWATSNDAKDKLKIEEDIAKQKETLSKEFSKYKKLKFEREEQEFSGNLYRHLIEFDFYQQREKWRDFTDQSNGIGSFVIHSKGEYYDIKEQYWLWKHVFLDELDIVENFYEVKFFEAESNNIYDLYSWFKKSILQSDMHSGIKYTQEYLSKDIEVLYNEILKKLATQHIIIPIYLAETEPNFRLFEEFLKLIWTPITEKIRSSQSVLPNWLMMFIIDKELTFSHLYSDKLDASINTYWPLLLPTISHPDSEMLVDWAKKGDSKGLFFRKTRNIQSCRELRDKLLDSTINNKLIPDCGRVELLLDIICKKLRPDLNDYGLKKVIAYAKEA